MPRIQIGDLAENARVRIPASYEEARDFVEKYAQERLRPSAADRVPSLPVSRATPAQAAAHPGFAAYMQECLHDTAFGYYETGRVAFGQDQHFNTYPRLLSPLFGWMVAERALAAFSAMVDQGLVPESEPFTILELGGGDGTLARDVLEYLETRAGGRRRPCTAARIRYVVGEHSEALRVRQKARLERFTAVGKAAVVPLDAAGEIVLNGPFYGLIAANELVDNLPCERIRFRSARSSPARVHVVLEYPEQCGPRTPAPFRPAGELEVDLADGWMDPQGKAGTVPPELAAYLREISPLVEDLERCGLLPAELAWSPLLSPLVRNIASLISGSGRLGAALILDYGGTSRHVLDPRSAGPHLRVYGGDRSLAHSGLVYHQPGMCDITCDVDFTHLAASARDRGLDVAFFGHQSALEGPPVDLTTGESLHALAWKLDPGRVPSVPPGTQALLRVARFRQAEGFRMLALAPPCFPSNGLGFGEPDDWNGDGLHTLRAGVGRPDLERALEGHRLPGAIARCLKPCGDVVADLSDFRMYRYRWEVIALLKEKGWLAAPGETAGRVRGTNMQSNRIV